MIGRLRESKGAGRLGRLVPARRTRERPPRRTAATAPQPAKPAAAPPRAEPPADLVIERDRLIEKFTIMQTDLGGAFYEMAVRDHVRLDALTAKAAELQEIDIELARVERAIELERTGAVGHCSNCDAPYGPGVVFCSQCGHVLEQVVEPGPVGSES